MSKRTKGPWWVDGRFIYGAGRTYPLCEVPTHGVAHSGVDAANAHLIAAAPDMYAVLKSMEMDQGDPRRAALLAAIAKAEGK